jgi:hypothetical protein
MCIDAIYFKDQFNWIDEKYNRIGGSAQVSGGKLISLVSRALTQTWIQFYCRSVMLDNIVYFS